MTDDEWEDFKRRVDRDYIIALWAFGWILAVVLVLPFTLFFRAQETPIRQQPVSTRCFPPNTELPFTPGLLGPPQPAIPGCPDYRMNEGMET